MKKIIALLILSACGGAPSLNIQVPNKTVTPGAGTGTVISGGNTGDVGNTGGTGDTGNGGNNGGGGNITPPPSALICTASGNSISCTSGNLGAATQAINVAGMFDGYDVENVDSVTNNILATDSVVCQAGATSSGGSPCYAQSVCVTVSVVVPFQVNDAMITKCGTQLEMNATDITQYTLVEGQ